MAHCHLTNDNHHNWKSLFLTVLKTNKIFDTVTNTIPPPATLEDGVTPNPAFALSEQASGLLLGWIQATVR